MRIQIYISVTVLILFQKSASEAVSRPPPPANVTIHCDNYGVEARWEYPDQSRDVYFFVEVTYSTGRESETTQNLSLNISSMLSRPAFNRYFVTVRAVRGGLESDLCESAIFSFTAEADSKIKCYLDFPEVELSPKDGKLHVQFINPPHLYRNTPALRDLVDLNYYIETEESKKSFTCGMKNETCESSIEFSEHRGVYCVNLTGKFGQRPLNPRSKCFEGDISIYPSFTVYLYPVLGVASTLIFITVIIMLLAKKFNSEIKKNAITAFPKFLVFNPAPAGQCKVLKVETENMDSKVKIEPVGDPQEKTTLIEMYSDEEQSSGDRDVRIGDLDNESAYGPNMLDEDDEDNEDEPGSLSNGYDSPHINLCL
ncbi:interferon gamma receptor 1 [Megalobrama amblycephala]|uniref:interferon gamma receptor 1 n=1 Tax=Megalobrama amblycephala TaxID=75352 RepID=UPI00201417A3|nr:interferon gamma receptor 1 [Megalobrama amblycephala]